MISLLTVTFNRSKQLNNFFNTVSRQTIIPDEIIIVNDGSTDDTERIIEAWQEKLPIKCINTNFHEHRISCIPKNIGLREIKGDTIIYSESELLLPKDTFEKMLNQKNDKNFVVNTQLWTMGKTAWEFMNYEEVRHPTLLFNHKYAMLVSGNMQNSKAPNSDEAISGSINCYSGSMFVASKKDIFAINGFDESMEGHGWEDWDVLHRLEVMGLKQIMYNDAPIIHQWHEKNYPYNIYEMADKNGKISEENTNKGIFKIKNGIEKI